MCSLGTFILDWREGVGEDACVRMRHKRLRRDRTQGETHSALSQKSLTTLCAVMNCPSWTKRGFQDLFKVFLSCGGHSPGDSFVLSHLCQIQACQMSTDSSRLIEETRSFSNMRIIRCSRSFSDRGHEQPRMGKQF